jgi:putative ATPase
MEAPLAERIRPQKLDDYVVSLSSCRPNGSLTQQIAKGIIPSLILDHQALEKQPYHKLSLRI